MSSPFVDGRERDNPFRAGLFDGEVALVTGGATGIGLATARELLQLGARVALCGRTEARVLAAAAALNEQYPGRALGRATDIREPQQIEALVERSSTSSAVSTCW